MAETMVQRVARAIYEGRNGRGCAQWARLPHAHRAPYLADARAAIEAMRGLTSAMRLAVWYDQYKFNGGSDSEATELATQKVNDAEQLAQDMSAFNAMIDAALSETEGG